MQFFESREFAKLQILSKNYYQFKKDLVEGNGKAPFIYAKYCGFYFHEIMKFLLFLSGGVLLFAVYHFFMVSYSTSLALGAIILSLLSYGLVDYLAVSGQYFMHGLFFCLFLRLLLSFFQLFDSKRWLEIDEGSRVSLESSGN